MDGGEQFETSVERFEMKLPADALESSLHRAKVAVRVVARGGQLSVAAHTQRRIRRVVFEMQARQARPRAVGQRQGRSRGLQERRLDSGIELRRRADDVDFGAERQSAARAVGKFAQAAKQMLARVVERRQRIDSSAQLLARLHREVQCFLRTGADGRIAKRVDGRRQPVGREFEQMTDAAVQLDADALPLLGNG